MKYTIRAYGFEKENNITVECSSIEDMAFYAKAIMLQVYKKVVTIIENGDEKL